MYIDDIDVIMNEKLWEAEKLRKRADKINQSSYKKFKRTKELMIQLKDKLAEMNRLSTESAIEIDIKNKETNQLKHEMFKNSK